MRRMIVTPEEKLRLLSERKKRYDETVLAAHRFLVTYLPSNGPMPHFDFMVDMLGRLGLRMYEQVQHIDFPTVRLEVVGAASTANAYQPRSDERFYADAPSVAFLLNIYVRLYDNHKMRHRVVPAIKLRKI